MRCRLVETADRSSLTKYRKPPARKFGQTLNVNKGKTEALVSWGRKKGHRCFPMQRFTKIAMEETSVGCSLPSARQHETRAGHNATPNCKARSFSVLMEVRVFAKKWPKLRSDAVPVHTLQWVLLFPVLPTWSSRVRISVLTPGLSLIVRHCAVT